MAKFKLFAWPPNKRQECRKYAPELGLVRSERVVDDNRKRRVFKEREKLVVVDQNLDADAYSLDNLLRNGVPVSEVPTQFIPSGLDDMERIANESLRIVPESLAEPVAAPVESSSAPAESSPVPVEPSSAPVLNV